MNRYDTFFARINFEIQHEINISNCEIKDLLLMVSYDVMQKLKLDSKYFMFKNDGNPCSFMGVSLMVSNELKENQYILMKALCSGYYDESKIGE